MTPRQNRNDEKRGEDDSGNVDSVGNTVGLRKSRGTQEGISLELEMRTNNNHSKGINTCALSLI